VPIPLPLEYAYSSSPTSHAFATEVAVARVESTRAKDSPEGERPSSWLLPSTRVAGSVRWKGWRPLPSDTARPRLASAGAPRRATTSDESRCFSPLRNPDARGLLLCVDPTPSHAALHFREGALLQGVAPFAPPRRRLALVSQAPRGGSAEHGQRAFAPRTARLHG